MAIVELARPPSARTLYRRAALRALRRRSTDTLPERTLRLSGVAVDRTRLAAYHRGCGFPLADRLPPTYPHVLAFPLAMELMSAADFPFPVVGLVHVANAITVVRPVAADETLDLTVHAEHLRRHDRGRQLDVVAVASVAGAEVWRGVSTYLRREAKTGGREASAGGGRGRADSGPAGAREDEAPRPDAVWRLPRSIGRDYAAVSGDRNPIHTSRLGARLFGFPRPIAHGMWSKARCLAALGARLPDAYRVEVAFKLPVLLPASVGFTAAPTGGGWDFALHDARTGKPHLKGTVRVG